MKIDQLQPKQLGIAYFDSDPHGAHIYVDGQILIDPETEEALRTPAKANLYEGRHDFTIVLDGYEDSSGYFDIFPGVTVNIYKRLKHGKSEEGWGEPQPQIWLSQQPGIIKIYSYPDGADVYIDGGHIGKTPTTANISPGVHTVTFRMPGMMEESKLVDVHPGSWSSIDATMRPILPNLYSNYEVKNMPGKLKITTNPSGAKIYIDNVLIKEKTPTMLSLPTGQHYIVLEIDGYFKDYNYVYIPASEIDMILERNLVRTSSALSESTMKKYIQHYFMSGEIRSLQSPTTGTLVITTYPADARIEMDGKMVIDVDTKAFLKTPVQLEVGMGLHNFIFKLEGYCNGFGSIYMNPGETRYLHINLNIC